MKKFEIIESYITYVRYTVEAEDREDARKKFHNGKAIYDTYGSESEKSGEEIEEINEIEGE